MLYQLRNAKRFITKLILALVTAAMIFYFGYSGFNKVIFRGGKHGMVAMVNGEGIPETKFERIYENQVKFYEQMTKNSLPPQFLNSLRRNVLDRLIENKIFAQQAAALGMEVSDKELANEITSNQSFYRDGIFDKKFYLENKSYYLQQNGEDYEQNLREQLLAEKFEKLVRDSVSLTEEEIKQEYLLSHTELNLQKISIDERFLKETSETKPVESVPQANKREKVESEILTALLDKTNSKNSSQKNSSLELLKTKYDLKIEETKPHSLKDKMVFIGDPNAKEAVECLFKLSAVAPTCPKGYLIGSQLVFFKLIERKDADFNQYEAEKPNLQKTLTEQRQALILHQIKNDLLKTASIHMYVGTAE